MGYLTQALSIMESSKREVAKIMEMIFRQALEEINRTYPSGLIGFIKTFHPERWQKLIDLESEIEKAWLEGKLESLRKASREYVELFYLEKEKYQTNRDRP